MRVKNQRLANHCFGSVSPNTIGLAVLSILMGGVLLLCLPSVTLGIPNIYVYPENFGAQPGTDFQVEIRISGAVDVYAWELQLRWSASVLSYINASEGDFLKGLEGKPTYWVNPVVYENGSGVLLGCTRLGAGIMGVNGSGVLARVHFSAESIGETPVDLNTKLRDSYPSPIDHMAIDGFFSNMDGFPTPSFPMPDFTYSPKKPNIGDIVVFNATNSFDPYRAIVSYFWEFGDGATSNESDPITYHSYSEGGTYQVKLTITDNEGFRTSSAKDLYVRFRHDIKVVSLSSEPETAIVRQIVTVTVEISNVGSEAENLVNVIVYCNNVALDSGQIVTNLGPGQNRTLAFYVHTTGMSIGTHGIKAVATPVSGETSVNDNTKLDTFQITCIQSFISISTSSSTAVIGFTVDINGSLLDVYKNSLEAQTVVLSYTFAGAGTWIPVTSDETDQNGRYYVTWTPPATGYFTLKAEWAGNTTHFAANNTVSLSSIAYQNKYVFSVESNSTVTSMTFESTQRELTFTVSGHAGSMGYADVYIAKTLIGNIENVEVKLNGTEIEYTATSPVDSWLIHFTYQHSSHTVSMNLGSPASSLGEKIGIDPLITALVIAALATILIVAVIFVRRRRSHRKTAFI